MRLLSAIFLAASLAIVAADYVLLHFGQSYLDQESARLAHVRAEGRESAARAAAAEAVGEAIKQVLAREDQRSWREYSYLYVPEGSELVSAGAGFSLNLSPIRDIEGSESLVRTRFTFDQAGGFDSPWREPDPALVSALLGGEPDNPRAERLEKERRLERIARSRDRLFQELKRALPPPAPELHDAATFQVLNAACHPGLVGAEPEEAQSGNRLVQEKYEQAWALEKDIGRRVRNLKRQQRAVEGYGSFRGQELSNEARGQQEAEAPPAQGGGPGAPETGQTGQSDARATSLGEWIADALRPSRGQRDQTVQAEQTQQAQQAQQARSEEELLQAAAANDASTVRVSALTPVSIADPEQTGGRAVFLARSVGIDPWPLRPAPPAFQGLELDLDRAVAIAERALVRNEIAPRGVFPAGTEPSGPDGERYLTIGLPAPLEHLAIGIDAPPEAGDPLAMTRVLLLGAASLIFVLGTGGLGLLYLLLLRRTELARRRTDFVAAVSHELKAPLAGIRALAEMMDTGMVTREAKRTEYVSHILHESERLSRIIANVLDLSKLERHERTYDVRAEDPAASLLETARAFSGHLEREGTAFTVEVPGALPAVRCDRDALVQVVANLIDNASKYGKGDVSERAAGDGPTPAIRLSARPAEPPGEVVIEIVDNGPGIPERERLKVFEPFYRGRRHLVGSAGGAGLGLAIARRHVESMGGTLEVDEAPGGGARFRITLVA